MGKKLIGKRKLALGNDPALAYLPEFDARNELISNIAGIGWRMALMIIVPVIAGIKLDEKLNSKPSYTLAAFFIAIFGCGYLINRTYKQINADMASRFKSKKKIKPTPQKGLDD
ncbi:AtpZ/AtpI family protein [Candidatus Saccharibacteria bacterium]|nr:MAG: AtpZ/AtpI family protein [Candidatus Saccharibacteria bacterium]